MNEQRKPRKSTIFEKADLRTDPGEKINFIAKEITTLQTGLPANIESKKTESGTETNVIFDPEHPSQTTIKKAMDEILLNRIITTAKEKTALDGMGFLIDCIDLYEHHDEATEEEFIKLNVNPLRFYNGEGFAEKLKAALSEMKAAAAATAAAEIEAEKREGLKWNGKGTQLALFIIIMIDKGYLEPPKSPNGEINYSQLAQMVKQTFVVKDKLTTMIKELSHATNTILKREEIQEIYNIFPDIKEMP